MILILAQNPTSERSAKEPLAGTRSGATVRSWLKLLGDPDVLVMNASSKVGPVTWKDYDHVNVMEAVARCDRFVALGAYASGLLDRLEVRHFTLPHPSGRNRQNNDRKELRHQLGLCKVYINKTSSNYSKG